MPYKALGDLILPSLSGFFFFLSAISLTLFVQTSQKDLLFFKDLMLFHASLLLFTQLCLPEHPSNHLHSKVSLQLMTTYSTFNIQFFYHNNDYYTNYYTNSTNPPSSGSFLNEENLFSNSWNFNPGLFLHMSPILSLKYSLRLELQWSFLELRRKCQLRRWYLNMWTLTAGMCKSINVLFPLWKCKF